MLGFSNMRVLFDNSLNLLCNILYFLILARVLLSWIPMQPDNKIRQFFYVLTEPLLGPIRSLINKSPLGGGMMVDFSPVIVLFIIQILRNIIIRLIFTL